MDRTRLDAALNLVGRVGRRLPEPAASRLRPLYAKLRTPTPLPGPAESQAGSHPDPWGVDLKPARDLGPEPDLVPIPPAGPNPLRVWPKAPPADYLGQLDDHFQDKLASYWAGLQISDCEFYHRAVLKDGGVVDGHWNLVGGEEEYLGEVKMEGRRLLELGPASGWLTTWMTLRGAEVVGLDVGWDINVDLIPRPADMDMEALRKNYFDLINRTQNAWWYLHQNYGSKAKMVYGSIYDLPPDIGRFDTSVFAAILLHLRDPFKAMEQAAKYTDDTMVVVEPWIPDAFNGSVGTARWNPSGGVNPTAWWVHSPSAIEDMVKILGFTDVVTTYHHQPARPPYTDEPYEFRKMFTVVARRPSPGK